MKFLSLLVLVVLTLSFERHLLTSEKSVQKARVAYSPTKVSGHKLMHLKILENKYLQENRPLKLSIVRAMLLEIGETELKGRDPAGVVDIVRLRKDPSFLSLELTIEHLSHREQFKLSRRQSAFLK